MGMGVRGGNISPYLWRILMVLGFVYAKLCRRGSGEAGRSDADEDPVGGCWGGFGLGVADGEA